MNMLKGELGAQVERTTNDLLRKKGVNNNFNRILNELFDPKQNEEYDEKKEDNPLIKGRAITNNFITAIASIYKEEVLETMMQIIIQSIKQKVAYSDDILFICFQYEITKKGKKPKETVLYETIRDVVVDILSHTEHKKDWYWMKTYILSSSIWYVKVDPNEEKSQFLWYEIFEWVELETRRQSMILSKPMRAIENKFLAQWTRLISYDVDTRYKEIGVRQDVVPGGLKSEYTAHQLTQHVPISATFNPLTHYDLSQYLTKLLLICHELNDQFHFDMEQIFEVDKDTKENRQLRCVYMRGPVKRLERCYAKCQADYRDCAFPTAAHVLDIVRCSLIFEDITCMFYMRINHCFFVSKTKKRIKILFFYFYPCTYNKTNAFKKNMDLSCLSTYFLCGMFHFCLFLIVLDKTFCFDFCVLAMFFIYGYLAMLTGMDMFQDKMASKKFCVVEIVRVKNGFFEYKHDMAKYTDIKFNVLIKGKKYSVIGMFSLIALFSLIYSLNSCIVTICQTGEVQFLFRRMYQFKKIGHSLYSIERKLEFVDDMRDLLPIKLDLKKQLFIHAARDNVNGITG